MIFSSKPPFKTLRSTKEEHETDYQRARRQRSDVKKHGITGSTPSDSAKRITEHSKAKALANKKK